MDKSTLESMFSILSEVRKAEAKNATIGSLLGQLDYLDPKLEIDIPVNEDLQKFLVYYEEDKTTEPTPRYLTDIFSSYRGYYEDLTLYISSEARTPAMTVGDLKSLLIEALAKGEMTGYKGGEFPIREDTLLWLEEDRSYARSLAITGITEKDGKAILDILYVPLA